jgi:hypothetical protein
MRNLGVFFVLYSRLYAACCPLAMGLARIASLKRRHGGIAIRGDQVCD